MTDRINDAPDWVREITDDYERDIRHLLDLVTRGVALLPSSSAGWTNAQLQWLAEVRAAQEHIGENVGWEPSDE